jgi:hypothetical protein
VHDWLRDSKEQWILILDNADASFLLDGQLGGQSNAADSGNPLSPLREYIPQSRQGSVLITTRSREVALKLTEQRDIIIVEPMDEAHALALFEKKLGTQVHSNDIAELAAALEYIPLAIVQAAAYIFQRAPRCSVRQYLEEFKKSDRSKASLLNHKGGQLPRDREAANSIISTWQISFDHIRQSKPSAAELLSFMSCFDGQRIPEALLRYQSGHVKTPEDQQESAGDDDRDDASPSSVNDQFEDDILALRNHSLISVNADGTSFEMPLLLQRAMRDWLEAHGQLENWEQQFNRMLDAVFTTGEYENWTKGRAAVELDAASIGSFQSDHDVIHSEVVNEESNYTMTDISSDNQLKGSEKDLGYASASRPGTLITLSEPAFQDKPIGLPRAGKVDDNEV